MKQKTPAFSDKRFKKFKTKFTSVLPHHKLLLQLP